MTSEMGKPLAQARSEVEKRRSGCDYHARHAPALLAEEHPTGSPPNSFVTFQADWRRAGGHAVEFPLLAGSGPRPPP